MININTAPWFVIAQLPWIQDPAIANNDPDKFKLAKAIVAYRDKTNELSSTNPFFSGLYTGHFGPDYQTESGVGAGDGRQEGMQSPIAVREQLGFASVSELLNVTSDLDGDNVIDTAGNPYDPAYDFRRFVRDALGTLVPMDYTVDSVENDLEERDILFQRVSNLATVRSDVFTAYILVRLGEAGPQKRVIAIFDRTNVFTANDKPKLVALHPVPDPN